MSSIGYPDPDREGLRPIMQRDFSSLLNLRLRGGGVHLLSMNPTPLVSQAHPLDALNHEWVRHHGTSVTIVNERTETPCVNQTVPRKLVGCILEKLTGKNGMKC